MTMSLTKMERFNQLCRKVIEKLIQECPVSVRLTAETFGMEKGELLRGQYNESEDEYFLKHTLTWLAEEGFIRGKGEYYVITLMGLERYHSVPKNLLPD